MASTIERNTNTSKSGPALNTFPSHVIWTKDEGNVERFTYRLRTPPSSNDKKSAPSSIKENETEWKGGGGGEEVANSKARILRLERNIQFLQTQHKAMLRDLHVEIETLKLKNRDLQFQFVVGMPLRIDDEKEVTTRMHRSSSTQTDGNLHRDRERNQELHFSDSVPLRDRFRRFSHMEGELSSLRLALEDAENRNSSLSNLVSQLKSSHLKLKSKSANSITEPTLSKVSIPHLHEVSVPLSYARKFEEYEGLVRRLKKENVEQKQELEHVRSSLDNYRTVVKSSKPKDPSATDRLPKIAQTPLTARPNQARKTTELPYIHPLPAYREDSASKEKRYVSSRGHLQRETSNLNREPRCFDAQWTQHRLQQRRKGTERDYENKLGPESETRNEIDDDNW